MVTNTQWAIIVKMAYVPHGQLLSRQYATLKIKRGVHFAKAQEAQRKDIEQAFWVLQSRFAIVYGLARFWDQNTLWHIMTTCVIMRNMIIENKQGQSKDFNYNYMGTHMRPEMNRPNQEIFGNTSKDRRLCNT